MRCVDNYVVLPYPLADVLGLLAEGLGVGDLVVRDGREQLLLVLALSNIQLLGA